MSEPTSPTYVVHVIRDGNPLATDEMTYEATDIEDALGAVREAVSFLGRDWRAITIVHFEDVAKLMDGAHHIGSGPVDGPKQEPS